MNALRIIIRDRDFTTDGIIAKWPERDIEFVVQVQLTPTGVWNEVPMLWTPSAASKRPNIPNKPILP